LNARKAVALAKKTDPLADWLDTLAAAYAEVGKFNEAVKWQEKALSLPDWEKSEREEAQQRLELYKARKPYRETPK
jgi:hypothetical protein